MNNVGYNESDFKIMSQFIEWATVNGYDVWLSQCSANGSTFDLIRTEDAWLVWKAAYSIGVLEERNRVKDIVAKFGELGDTSG